LSQTALIITLTNSSQKHSCKQLSKALLQTALIITLANNPQKHSYKQLSKTLLQTALIITLANSSQKHSYKSTLTNSSHNHIKTSNPIPLQLQTPQKSKSKKIFSHKNITFYHKLEHSTSHQDHRPTVPKVFSPVQIKFLYNPVKKHFNHRAILS